MGSFCKFTVGGEGTSAPNLVYISRRDAVREKGRGVLFRNFPEHVQAAKTYRELRGNLEAYAWTREESEQARHKASGRQGTARSHYRCVLSYERNAATGTIHAMVEEWLSETLPTASVGAFVHRNTAQVHVHLWIDARGIDGKKLDFSPKQWRTIGSKWDRIYQRHMKRELLLEHRFGEGKGDEPRAASGAGRRDATRTSESEGPERSPSAGEQAARECAQSRREAIRELKSLRDCLEGLGREGKERDKEWER